MGTFQFCISNMASANPVGLGQPLAFTVTVTNACTPALGCSFTDNIEDFLPPNVSFVSGAFTAPSGSGTRNHHHRHYHHVHHHRGGGVSQSGDISLGG